MYIFAFVIITSNIDSQYRESVQKKRYKIMGIFILGQGYVGSYYAQSLERSQFTGGTSRRKQDLKIHFDLNQKETWKNLIPYLSNSESVLWTFPAAKHESDIDLSLEFFQTYLKNHFTLVLGSTSRYNPLFPDAWVNEDTSLYLNQPRVLAEEKLKEAGACLLALAGITGPGRDPILWLKQRKIPYAFKYFNPVSLPLILQAISGLMHLKPYGESYCLCDGSPKTWKDTADDYHSLGRLEQEFVFPYYTTTFDSKRVNSTKILKILNH